MAELEKVFKGLEHCGNGIKCETCPYHDENDPDEYSTSCNDLLCCDALELLKEQQERIKVLEDEETAKNKPMKVVYDMNPMTRLPVSFCPICGYAVDRYAYGRSDLPQVFCPYCGQALDWKDGDGE